MRVNDIGTKLAKKLLEKEKLPTFFARGHPAAQNTQVLFAFVLA